MSVAAFLLAGAALAEEPRCRTELDGVKREIEQTPLSTAKRTQVQALMEQVERACRENNDVVALAGLDQVRAVVSAERSGTGSSTGNGS